MSKNQLRQILIEARNKQGFSQEQVVSLCGNLISRQYYGMIENCERTPSVNVAKEIAKVLEIDWTIFFEV